eukprot:scaffold6704_cov143-Pinguiococcus_pyrenoidosus.AAC.1
MPHLTLSRQHARRPLTLCWEGRLESRHRILWEVFLRRPDHLPLRLPCELSLHSDASAAAHEGAPPPHSH